ncbi:MAG TPA: type IV secretion system DNA-binding domain-containing protein [Candidatus Magasanikbacteria bacterium]|nr:type IV secretion system DNA-binding domain-containing protein [Candidatus Magasanikbacteria bacterium]
MPTPSLQPKNGASVEDTQDICLFGQTNYRNQLYRFGIKLDDRRRHMYIIGKTGMGKTTMMENMVLHDIYSGHGVGVVDPHGDFAEKVINYIPSNRINDVVYFNPSDLSFPIGFNILEVKKEEQKHLVVAGLMGIFKKIWPDVWSPRMEYILNNTLLALLDYPGSTLLGINRMLSDKVYRGRVIGKIKDPVVKAFWETEFASYSERYATEAVASVQNKIGQFLSASVIRNMVAQVKSTIDIREIMDTKKILIMNLSKGRIGEDNSRLLGGMLITEIQLSAMERVDIPESERQDFFLYVDEFQNFATPSFANILSEARKYRLSLTMAHQYITQLDEIVADAVFGNVGTIVTFRVGGADAEFLEKEFTPTFLATDIVNLNKYQVMLKLMIDGVASQPFGALTMPPIGKPTGSAEKVIRVSRERYGRPRDVIEEKIMRWVGLEDLDDSDDKPIKHEHVPAHPPARPAEVKKPVVVPNRVVAATTYSGAPVSAQNKPTVMAVSKPQQNMTVMKKAVSKVEPGRQVVNNANKSVAKQTIPAMAPAVNPVAKKFEALKQLAVKPVENNPTSVDIGQSKKVDDDDAIRFEEDKPIRFSR